MKNALILGETCLLDYQLRRVGIIEGEHYLFDNMIVNLDGVIDLIEDEFIHAMDFNYMSYMIYPYYPDHGISHIKWVNTKYSKDIDNIFSWPLCSYFHYDSMDDDQKASIIRKINRTKSLIENGEDLTVFYYYRYSDKYDIPKLKEKLKYLIQFISDKYNKNMNVVLITNENSLENKLTISEEKNIYHGHFTTVQSWVTIDDNWDAHTNNDMFEEFLNRFKI